MSSETSRSGAPLATVHEAELATDGAVMWAAELTDDEAVQRRLLGLDVVVRGPDKAANVKKAKKIEGRIGRWEADKPHEKEGPLALPHLHQESRSPDGHCFYETARRQARKKRC
jgi:hypothetical protein